MRTFLMAIAVLPLLLSAPAEARRRRRPPAAAAAPAPAPAPDPTARHAGRTKVYDFTGLGIDGRMRTPQLLYFLSRVKEELDRAQLEKRTFIPELVRSIDEGGF
jgi:hypothetical protein